MLTLLSNAACQAPCPPRPSPLSTLTVRTPTAPAFLSGWNTRVCSRPPLTVTSRWICPSCSTPRTAESSLPGLEPGLSWSCSHSSWVSSLASSLRLIDALRVQGVTSQVRTARRPAQSLHRSPLSLGHGIDHGDLEPVVPAPVPGEGEALPPLGVEGGELLGLVLPAAQSNSVGKGEPGLRNGVKTKSRFFGCFDLFTSGKLPAVGRDTIKPQCW